jgi:hypothetical protein
MSLTATCGDRGLEEDENRLSCRETGESGEGLWDPEQLDGDLRSSWSAGIASQPFWKTEAIMRPVRTGKR